MALYQNDINIDVVAKYFDFYAYRPFKIGFECLTNFGALANDVPTALSYLLSALNILDVELALLIIAGIIFGCTQIAIDLAAVLSCTDNCKLL